MEALCKYKFKYNIYNYIMAELEVNLEVEGVEHDDLAKLTQEQIVEQFHKNGQINDDGWVNEDGELTPRFKQEARMGMTMEDEYQIDMWVKQMRRDFPNVDAALCDLVATHCYMHGDDCLLYTSPSPRDS